jgi:hypothetical protein
MTDRLIKEPGLLGELESVIDDRLGVRLLMMARKAPRSLGLERSLLCE